MESLWNLETFTLGWGKLKSSDVEVEKMVTRLPLQNDEGVTRWVVKNCRNVEKVWENYDIFEKVWEDCDILKKFEKIVTFWKSLRKLWHFEKFEKIMTFWKVWENCDILKSLRKLWHFEKFEKLVGVMEKVWEDCRSDEKSLGGL